jgi:CDP-diacylglycerol--serine O-phosphatidyltransferase
MARFGRKGSNPKPPRPKRLVLGVHPLPTMVTLGNLLCGFGSILLALRASSFAGADTFLKTPDDCLYWSGIMIFLAMLFDMMDGKVARWTKTSSKFGMEMDSLCDIVSFGVAPAVLVKAMIDQQLMSAGSYPMLEKYVLPMLALYVCCAALRLARYNVEAESGHRDFFFGMPSPGAAGCVASLATLIIPGNRHLTSIGQIQELTYLDNISKVMHGPVLLVFPFIMATLGVLMVSRVHYPHVGDRLLRGRKSFMHIMVLALLLILIVLHHEIMLVLAFNGYMIVGVVNEVRLQLFPSLRPPGWDVEQRTSSASGSNASAARVEVPPASASNPKSLAVSGDTLKQEPPPAPPLSNPTPP